MFAVKDYGVNTPKNKKSPRKRGRPQAFDRQLALDAAMRLFWEGGYEGTSFADLIAAMGISASTFYNSFGSKEQLYNEAVQHYLSGPNGARLGAILSGPDDTRTTFARIIDEVAREFTDPVSPTGCMISLAGTHVSPQLHSIRETMTKYRAGFEQMLVDRLQRGLAVGDLPPDTDIVQLASFFGTLFRGMAVQARDGKSQEHLRGLAQVAMRAWPSPSTKRPKVPQH